MFITDLQPIDRIRLNKDALVEMYNGSDIEALNYMYPFCEGELKDLCKRLININEEYNGDDGSDEYYEGKWKLLRYFGLEKDEDGEAYVK